jgi:hypothetical protein
MKPLRIFSITLILMLLVSNDPTARFHVQAAQLKTDSIRTYQVTKLLDAQNGGNNEAERLHFNYTQGLSRHKVTSMSEPSAPLAIQSFESGSWHLECIECTKQFGGTNRNFRLDDDGHPHIVYGSDHLYHAWHDGQKWHYETVDNAPGVGEGAALALDAAGNPHISYSDTIHDLKYAYWAGSAWQIQVVDSEGSTNGNVTSIALDTEGHPHIAYLSNYSLKYAYWTGSTWSIQGVDTVGMWGYLAAIAVDAANRPHIVYFSWTDDDLSHAYPKYARWTGSTWEIQTIGNGNSIGDPISLALDSAGLPHISFRDRSSNYSLKYVHWTGSTWIIQTVVGDERTYNSSIAVDASGAPHISYFSQNGGLKYAYWSGSLWVIQNVDAAGSYGSALALDASQRPHISYFIYHGGTDDELKYARWTGSMWDIEAVDHETSPVGEASLAVDAAGHAHISYTHDGFLYRHWNGSEWITQTVDTGGGSSSLVVDALGYPHISYIDGGIKYAHWTGSLWVTQTVASAGDVFGMFGTDLALGADGTPHIIYYDFADDYLKYAHWTGSSWNIQSVEKGIDLGSAPGISAFSLALDSMGYPHITYLTTDTAYLRYARWTGTAWDIQTIATEITTGRTSLALDAANRPHLCFRDGAYRDEGLKYAHWIGSAWDIQTLDNEFGAGFSCSLALDAAGNPRISYRGRYGLGLKYARWMSNTWMIQMVDNLGGPYGGPDFDLALDTAGNPHLTYFKTGDNDMYYARLLSPIAIEQAAAPRDGLSMTNTLTFTLTLSGPGVNARLWDPLPSNVEYIPGSVTAPAVYSSTARAIMWQGILPTDTVQVVHFMVIPSATVTSGQSLSPVIINTAWLTDTEYNRTVSAISIINGWYLYLPLVRR